MGIMKRDGSDISVQQDLYQSATGSPYVPSNINTLSPLAESVVTSTSDLTNYPIVNNPQTDKVAIDTTTYPQATGALLGYAAGHRIRVTYFNQLNLGSSVRTNVADWENESNLVNVAYARINNFEITLKNAVNFDYNPDKGNANLEGQALIYPQFKPLIGDVILYPIGEGKLMLMRVSSVQPLSWRNEHYTEISYYSFSYADAAKLSQLQTATRYTYWFDKNTYLLNGAVLLEESYYRDLRDLKIFRNVLAQYYYRQFFDLALNTYIRPDGIYDPYVTEYMANMVSVTEVDRRPSQIYRDTFLTYQNTLWHRLLDPYNTSIEDVSPYYAIKVFTGYANNIMLTPLTDERYLLSLSRKEVDPYVDGETQYNLLNNPVFPLSVNPVPLVTPPPTQPLPAVSTYPFFNGGQPFGFYVLSANFYNGNTKDMTPLELTVWNAMRTKQLSDTGALLSLFIRQYLNLSPMDAFYQIPIYLRLIDIGVASIARKPPTLGL